jgi:hypothetical protein
MSAFRSLHGDEVASYPFHLQHALSDLSGDCKQISPQNVNECYMKDSKKLLCFPGGYFLSSLKGYAIICHFLNRKLS